MNHIGPFLGRNHNHGLIREAFAQGLQCPNAVKTRQTKIEQHQIETGILVQQLTGLFKTRRRLMRQPLTLRAENDREGFVDQGMIVDQ